MIDIKVISSGSQYGNSTLLTTDNGTTILCDVGTTLPKILEATNYETPDYAIITHEHSDHAKMATIKELLKRGTDVWTTKGTAEKLGLKKYHNLHILKPELLMSPITLGNCQIKALNAQHDAAEPMVFKVADLDDKVLYATDTRRPPLWASRRPYTKIVIEANFVTELLEASDIQESLKARIFNNHISIERIEDFFRYLKHDHRIDFITPIKEIHLIHRSDKHGDKKYFKEAVRRIVGDKAQIFTY